MHKLENKIHRVKDQIISCGKVAVSFSGGVGSCVILKLAKTLLGDNCIAITINSPFIPNHEIIEAKHIAKSLAVKHIIKDMSKDTVLEILSNNDQICRECKKKTMDLVGEEADKLGSYYIFEGSVHSPDFKIDDFFEAMSEHSVIFPLVEVHMDKKDIFHAAHLLDIHVESETRNVCLVSRIKDKPVNYDKLRMLEKADTLLNELGIHNSIIQMIQGTAIIETIPTDYKLLVLHSDSIKKDMQKIGFNDMKIITKK